MERYKIYPRGFGANTYILTADGKNAVVIDPSSYTVVRELAERELVPAYVLLTHCHFDHVMFAADLQAKGAKVVCLDKEKANVGSKVALFALAGVEEKPFTVDKTVTDGERFTLAGMEFLAMSLPGHTSGSAAYLTENGGEKWLFTGDVLFEDSIGRTDFPTGSLADMRESLRILKNLEGEYLIFSGHGEDTTLSREKAKNIYLLDA
ncbi:MAG: MBL fold metallo-hydrolase [Clostridia bacterium]|nr:MBL fold metallo-hydrolase [Clostridia bacterium]